MQRGKPTRDCRLNAKSDESKNERTRAGIGRLARMAERGASKSSFTDQADNEGYRGVEGRAIRRSIAKGTPMRELGQVLQASIGGKNSVFIVSSATQLSFWI